MIKTVLSPGLAGTEVSYALAVPVVLLAGLSGGCAVVAVTNAVVTVAATVAVTAVNVGASVVGGGVDVARAGVRAVTNNTDQRK